VTASAAFGTSQNPSCRTNFFRGFDTVYFSWNNFFMTNSSKSALVAISVAILATLVTIAAYQLGRKSNPPPPPPVATTPAAASITDTGMAGQKLYTNPQAGISFLFPTEVGDETIDVKQVGSKIFVYNTKYPYTQGQYVEVFEKNSPDTLTQGIQKQFLTNIPAKDCFVKDAKPDSTAKFPASYEVKTLGYPVDENSDAPYFAQANKCPEPYAQTNGLSYFLGDTQHPKNFLFFSIGQYGIGNWQDTVKFLD
jgi:hypothetical protein